MDKTIPFDIRRHAEDFCLECGFPIHRVGFESAVLAISCAVQNERLVCNLKNDLYHAVSALSDRSFSYNSFRHAIEDSLTYAFDHYQDNKISEHFGSCAPSVKQFIFTGARYVRNHKSAPIESGNSQRARNTQERIG